jgi:NitT/TauT family transport system ATP-binding protein
MPEPAMQPGAAPADAKVEFRQVSKTFVGRGQSIPAITGIDLTIRSGEFVALIGPSGCGKSTLLNMTAGFLKPSEGQVTYDGAAIEGLNLKTGYMTQKDTLLPWRNAADNIGIALELSCRAMPKAEARERVQQIIDITGLRGF